jgi:hypothetical protein
MFTRKDERGFYMPKSILLIIAVLTLVVGCMQVKYGRMPDTAALQSQLTQHVSSKADVLKVLGPPRGYGMANLSMMPNPHATWFYEYLESDGKNVDFKMLLVFFDGETYSGHFWFSSVEQIEVVK